MNSLPADFSALVIGSTGGIGTAVVAALEADPACGRVVGLSRASTPAVDLTDEASVEAAAAWLAGNGAPFHLMFDATGGLTLDGAGPEKTIRRLDAGAMAQQFAVNAMGPALLLKHFHSLMAADRRAVFATLSARVGSIGDNQLGGWISYRAAKAALNQIVRTAAIEIARKRPDAVVVALHPGTVRTRLSDGIARDITHEPPEAARDMLDVLDRLTPAQSGGFFAYDGSPIPY